MTLIPGWRRLALWEGGTVAGLATARAADGSTVVFAATPIGVFRSTDSGRSWGPLGDGSALAGVEVVAPSPRFARDALLFAGARAGLYRWRAGGEGWEHLLGGCRALSLVCPPGEGSDLTLLAGTEHDGVLLSRDTGRTWTGANPGLLDLTVLALAVSPDFGRDGLGFAATPSGLYRTRNGAESWRPIELEWDELVIQCLAISPRFPEDRLVLAGTEEQGLLRSEDAGRTWTNVLNLAERSLNSLALSARGLVAAATEAGLTLSVDGGRSWRAVGAKLGPVLSVAVVEDPSGEALLAGLPGAGLARSVDRGQSWEPANVGLQASLLVGLSLSPDFGSDETIFAASLETGVSVSQDGGRTWAERNAGLEDTSVWQVAVSPRFAADGSLYAATGAGLYTSRDRGLSWGPALPGEPSTPAGAVVAADAGGAVLVLAALPGGRLVASDDGGATWRWPATPSSEAEVVALAVSPTYVIDGTIFAATAHPELAEGPAGQDGSSELVVWRRTERSGRWERWLEERGAPPVQLAALPANPRGGALVVGLGGRLFGPIRSAQEVRAGLRRPLWRSVELPGRPAAITGLAASPSFQEDRTLFAATSAGVYVSRDGGESFTAWSEGLEPSSVVAVAPSPAYARDRLVYALGLGGTIWRRRDR